MWTVGLLGGMSWVSSAEYYRLLNEKVRDELGEYHSARCVMYSVDFADVEMLQVEDRWAEAGALLADAARRVEAAGADLLLLCTNTMHRVADDIQAAIGIPLLDLADATARAVRAAGVTRVGLPGTAYTMEHEHYRGRLASHGLDVLVPEADDRAEVHRIVVDELVRGVVTEESRATYRAVIDRLAAAGAEGVVLGCTEIELLGRPRDSALPTFPTTRLHVEAAVADALAGP